MNEKLLRELLNEAFEAGFYGCKDLQENVVEELVGKSKIKKEEEKKKENFFTLPNTNSINVTMQEAANRNGDVFLRHLNNNPWMSTSDVRIAEQPQIESELDIESVQIVANEEVPGWVLEGIDEEHPSV